MLFVYVALSDNGIEYDSNFNEKSNDTVSIWIMDDYGNLKLIPTTDTYYDSSACT